jgi:hypothetical protein
MQPQKIDELPTLNIEKATETAQEYARELEELECEELTDKQVQALTKFTREFIPAYINAEEY